MNALLAAILLDMTIKATAILLAAWGASLLLRRGSAAARHMAWTAAVLGVLLLPVLSWTLPAWRVLPWMPEVPAAEDRARATPAVPPRRRLRYCLKVRPRCPSRGRFPRSLQPLHRISRPKPRNRSLHRPPPISPQPWRTIWYGRGYWVRPAWRCPCSHP